MSEELNAKEVNAAELNQAAGGNDGMGRSICVGNTYTTSVATGYLALRNAACYDENNEIGALFNGSTVTVNQYPFGDYAYVTVQYAAPGEAGYKKAVAGQVGFVNAKYLY